MPTGTKKLFVFYVGGDAPNSNIELHDIRFAVAERMEDCFDDLRKQWWGSPDSIHIDCWCDLTHADGYAIELRPEPFTGPERLFFTNLGGYDKDVFGEIHHNVFVVAEGIKPATVKALAQINWKMKHRDAIYEVEKIKELEKTAAEYGLYVHLTPAPDAPPCPFTTALYIKLGVPAA